MTTPKDAPSPETLPAPPLAPRFVAHLPHPVDYTREAQGMEDAHLLQRFRKTAEQMRSWVNAVADAANAAPAFDDLVTFGMRDPGEYAFVMAEFFSLLGAAQHMSRTRLPETPPIELRRPPEPRPPSASKPTKRRRR